MRTRPTTEGDLDQVLACPATEPAGLIPADRYRDELARHHYPPEWTWIAEDAGRILAHAIWWGFGDSAYPLALDCVSADESPTDRAALAAELIAAGQHALRPPGGEIAPPLRDHPAGRLAVGPGR